MTAELLLLSEMKKEEEDSYRRFQAPLAWTSMQVASHLRLLIKRPRTLHIPQLIIALLRTCNRYNCVDYASAYTSPCVTNNYLLREVALTLIRIEFLKNNGRISSVLVGAEYRTELSSHRHRAIRVALPLPGRRKRRPLRGGDANTLVSRCLQSSQEPRELAPAFDQSPDGQWFH